MLTEASRGRRFPCKGSPQSGIRIIVLTCSPGTTATLVLLFFLPSGGLRCVPQEPETMARILRQTVTDTTASAPRILLSVSPCASGLAMERGARGHQRYTLGEQEIKQDSGQRRISGVQLCRRRHRRRRCKHRPQRPRRAPRCPRSHSAMAPGEPTRRVVNALGDCLMLVPRFCQDSAKIQGPGGVECFLRPCPRYHRHL